MVTSAWARKRELARLVWILSPGDWDSRAGWRVASAVETRAWTQWWRRRQVCGAFIAGLDILLRRGADSLALWELG